MLHGKLFLICIGITEGSTQIFGTRQVTHCCPDIGGMGRSHDFLETGKSAEALKVQFGQSELPIELLCSQESRSCSAGIATSGNLCPVDMGQFLATRMPGHDPP